MASSMFFLKQIRKRNVIASIGSNRKMYTISKMGLSTNGPSLLEMTLQNLQSAYESKDIESITSQIKIIAKSSEAPTMRDHISKFITKKSIEAMTKDTIGDNVYSVGKIGLSFTVPQYKTVCVELLKKFTSLKGMGSKSITKSMSGFSACELKWEFMPEALQNEMFARLIEICPVLDLLQMSVVLESLAEMEVEWNQIPSELQFGLIAKLSIIDATFKAQYVSTIFKSLGQLQYRLQHNGNMAEEVLVSTLSSMAVRVFSSQENSFHDPYFFPRLLGTLDGCAKIGLTFECMPRALQLTLMDFMENNLLHISVDNFAKVCTTLGRLKMRYVDFSDDAQFCVSKSIDKYISRFSDKEFAELMSALSSGMEIKMSDLPVVTAKNILQSAENRFHFLENQTMAFILMGLSRMGVLQSTMSKDFASQIDKKLARTFLTMTESEQQYSSRALRDMKFSRGLMSSELDKIIKDHTVADLRKNGKWRHGEDQSYAREWVRHNHKNINNHASKKWR